MYWFLKLRSLEVRLTLDPTESWTSEQGLGCSLPTKVLASFSPCKMGFPMFRERIEKREPMASDSSWVHITPVPPRERELGLSLSIYVVTGVDSCSDARPSHALRASGMLNLGPMCVCKGV